MKFKIDPERYKYFQRPKDYFDIIERIDGTKFYYIKSIQHFREVLKKSNRTQQDKQYAYNIIATIDKNVGLASQKQKIILDRIKTGDKFYSPKNEIKVNPPLTYKADITNTFNRDFERGRNIKITIQNLLKVNHPMTESQIVYILSKVMRMYSPKVVMDNLRRTPNIVRVKRRLPPHNRFTYLYSYEEGGNL